MRSAVGMTGAALVGALPASAAEPVPRAEAPKDRPIPKSDKRDYRTESFKVVVAFGESTTAGGTATSREFNWVTRLTELINESQLEPIRMINSGIGGNVVSSRSITYQRNGKPSAMERYKKHVVDHRPQLVLISYGLNDARGGTPLEHFLEDLRKVVMAIKSETSALVVIVSAYFMSEFHRYSKDNLGTIATFIGYNAGLERLAKECDTLFADVWAAEGMAPWMVDEDGVHANNLGHRVIANRIFEVLAQNCSCLSAKTLELRKTFKPWRDESALRKDY